MKPPLQQAKADLAHLRQFVPSSKAARDVLAERARQIETEGWTADHDDEWHDRGELARAAGCYALHAGARGAWSESSYRKAAPLYHDPVEGHELWPFGAEWWKPKDPRRDLVRAAALILAEIERIDRASLKAGE